MTYIEFFDKVASENVSACLTHIPERVIYIGDNAKLMKKHIARYSQVFADRGYTIDFSCKTVSKSNLDSAVELLTELVQTYDDCVFDITGGDEILNLALGIVYARNPDKNIQIQRFNLRNNTAYDCDKDGNVVYKDTPTLSVEENVRIYGGDILYGDISEDNTYRWELTPEFLEDIDLLWSICRKDVRYWNVQIGMFEAIEKVGKVEADGLTTVASHNALEAYLDQRGIKSKKAKGILAQLKKYGLLTCYDDEDAYITVSYKDLQVKKCLTKAGQVLEMKVFTVARSLREPDGAPVYDDAVNGVVIDWDGDFHDEETEAVFDTENEIDVLLTHDVIPVFISCKNGAVTADELYKLSVVAERFGGRYAKKVLVATAIPATGEAGQYLRQRAKDMNIRLVENVQTMEEAEFARRLKNLWNN